MNKLPAWIFHSRFWGITWIAWFVVLFVLSSFSLKQKTVELPTFSDKIAHFAYFACGSAVLAVWLWIRFPGLRRITTAVLVVGAAAAVGAFDEWHQTFTPGRSGLDAGDWIADVCGGIAGWAMIAIIKCRAAVAGRSLSA